MLTKKIISKNYLIKLVLVTFIISSCKSTLYKKRNDSYNNYYEVASKADSLFILKKYADVYNTLDTLFKRVTPINSFRFREYTKYLKVKYILDKKISKKEMELLISKYGMTNLNIKKDSVLNLMYNTIDENDSFYKKNREKYISLLDLKLRKKIFNMLEKDQLYRYDSDTLKIKKQDSLNEREIRKLFQNNIYPNKSVIGGYFFDENVPDIEVLLLHTKDSLRLNFYLPKIKKFIGEGKCNPYIYAMLVDQLNLYNDRPQVLGSYDVNDIPKQKYKEYNRNRKKLGIGLPSIEFDIWKSNYQNKLRHD